jgi:hypothetical protein
VKFCPFLRVLDLEAHEAIWVNHVRLMKDLLAIQ